MSFAGKWMKLEIMLSTPEKYKCHMLSLIYRILSKGEKNE
jgi:hypothetical protein